MLAMILSFPPPQRAARRDHAVVARQVHPRRRSQRRQPGVLNVALDQATALQCDANAGGNLLHPYGTLRGRRRRQMPKHRPRAVESQNYAVQKGRRCRGALMPPSRSRSAPGCVCSGAAPIEQRAIPDRSVRGRSTRGTTTPTPKTWPTRSRKPTIAGWRV